MPLPAAIRSRTPPKLKDHPGIRAAALAAGLIPPRPMHTSAEAEILRELARRAGCVVEIGVYEGSSAVMFCDALGPGAKLHLIDPFIDESGWTMVPGWHGTPFATRLAVRRRARGGPTIHWHIARSQDVGRAWPGPPVDLVFIDGDHSVSGCREDWEVWHPHVRTGGSVAMHDARRGLAGGTGGVGPSEVAAELREGTPPGWSITTEVDSLLVLQRAAC